MSYNANEHDRSGRCVRHPEVKLLKRKLFLPGTKYVFKWSKRIQYCPCCVVEFVLAVDPDVKGEVGLSRKGRIEITNIAPECEPTCTIVASMPSSQHNIVNNNIVSDDSDHSSHISGESDNSSHAASSYASRESTALNCAHVEVDDTSFGKNVDQAADEVHSQSLRKNEEIHNINDDNSHEQQRPQQQQLKSSPTDVRELQKHLKPDLHGEDSTKPPVDDVFVCKDLIGSASLNSTSDIDVLFGLAQLETVPAHIASEIEKEQAWNTSLDSWQKEKEEMAEEIYALKKENKQLQISMKCMKKWQNKPPSEDFQNLGVANVSLSDSQESSYKEMIHQQGIVIQSLRDEIKSVSTDQIKRLQDIVSLLQQQVKTLEDEKEINRAMHEQEIDVLQQEIQSLEQKHTETVCRMVKMAIQHERKNNQVLLNKFEEIEHARMLQIAQKREIGMKEECSNPKAELKVEMTKEEVMELNENYVSLKSELDEIKAKVAGNERRKKKSGVKKKKSKKKQRGRRKTMNDGIGKEAMPLPIDELLVGTFVQLGFDTKEPSELDALNELMSKS